MALGTTQFLVSCVRGLIESGCTIQSLISLPKHLLPDNSIDVKKFSVEIGSEYFETDNINSKASKDYIRSLSPELIFSSWPKLIDSEFLSIPIFGTIGTHPTELPLNKGRHPLQWQIVLGLKHSKLSFFWMDAGVDSGALIMQAPYPIHSDDTIVSLAKRVNAVAFSASKTIGKELMTSGTLKRTEQNNKQTNTWRKRSRHDVLIDFRMNADKILALIRSFTLPYPCSTFIFESDLLHVVSGEISQREELFDNIEPGKIISIGTHFIEVKTADKLLKLKTLEDVEAVVGSKKYIHPPTMYLLKNPELFIHSF
ncbi:MAG: formyltransferase family protein [Bacteroidia bacterium]|nr:formyltransferase family protein [Bacteroidia bacterium]